MRLVSTILLALAPAAIASVPTTGSNAAAGPGCVQAGPVDIRGSLAKAVTKAEDFTGVGVAGGTATGVVGGIPQRMPAVEPLFAVQVERRVEPGDPGRPNTEEYAKIDEYPFTSVAQSPLSTFSIDVDHASYSNVRRMVCSGSMPPKDAVRIEEMINYFPYHYRAPVADGVGRDPISVSTDVATAPWNADHKLVRVALQTAALPPERMPPSNLVFLIDVSGSMHPENRLPLVKQAFRLLVDQLRPHNRVAIVVYAGAAGLVLPSTPASDKAAILGAIDRLSAGGSTAGGAGIRLAYDVAKANQVPGGNNRVILATDGDFNVGTSSTAELIELVESRRAEGTYLTTLGFGMGNLKDNRLEGLADRGNGNYAYIDDLIEARKVFVEELSATLVAVANDVKIQVEFNPAAVQAYRLIGYENRALAARDFTNDAKDAGEIGAGHAVTALYEVVLTGKPLDVAVGNVPALRYQSTTTTRTTGVGELMTVSLRYKVPGSSQSLLKAQVVEDQRRQPDADFRFAMAVAGYGMLVRESPHRGTFSLDDAIALAKGALDDDRGGYRKEFVAIAEATRRILADRPR
jgi:Ca-activated chloride channel family protein